MESEIWVFDFWGVLEAWAWKETKKNFGVLKL